MAGTVADASLRAKQWDEKFHMEYVRNNRFARYSGTGANAVFQYNETLTGKRGETIHCNLVGVPRGTPNDGSTQLVGNEKQQFNYAHATTVAVVRDAVVVNAQEEQAAGISLRNAARQGLRDMASEYLKQDQINALDDRTAQGRLTDDQWHTANRDRILYGDQGPEATLATFAAGLTAATAQGTAAMIQKAKDMAEGTGAAIGGTNDRNAQNRMRPIRTVADDEEWFVLFCEGILHRQFLNDATIAQSNREAWQRYGGEARTGGNGGNPLFRGGDIIYDGVIIRKIPEIGDLAALATDRARGYLCGAQAVHVAWAQRTRTTVRKEDDYGFQYGVGFQELRKVDKVFWQGNNATTLKQWGIVSIYAAKS